MQGGLPILVGKQKARSVATALFFSKTGRNACFANVTGMKE